MKQIAFLIFFILSLQWFELLNAQWAKTYGGSEDDLGYGIQQTRDRGYIVSGITASSGAGGGDLWVFKLDSNGTIQWQRIYGGGARDCAYPIQQTSDGGYVVAGETYSFGAGENDFWILKLDPAGLNQWQYTYGGSKIEFPYSLQQTGDGGYIVAGQSDSFGNNGADFWILKLNSTGAIQWQRTYGGWEKECPYSIQKTKDGGFIVAGETRSFGAGDNDFWIVKISSTGSIDWQYTYGGSGYERAYYIQQTSEGGYVVAGSTDSFGAGGDDFWILKLNSTGAITWQHTYGGDSHERPHSIRQTGDEGYVVIGYTFSFGIGEANFWILKLNPTGAIEWQQTFGRGHFNDPNSLQQTNDGGYIINGFTDSFGAGKYDFLVVKIDSNGYIDPTCEYMKESNATSSDTNILPQDTYVLPVDTNINPQDTPVSPQETDATVSLICGCDTTILSLSTSTLNFGAIVSRADTCS